MHFVTFTLLFIHLNWGFYMFYQAYGIATSRCYNGYQGYIASVGSATENAYIVVAGFVSIFSIPLSPPPVAFLIRLNAHICLTYMHIFLS